MSNCTEKSGWLSLVATSKSTTSCGSARDWPASWRGLGFSPSKPDFRYVLSQSLIVSIATRVRVVPGMQYFFPAFSSNCAYSPGRPGGRCVKSAITP